MHLRSYGKTLAARSALALIALSLAACGGTTTTVAPTAPPIVATVVATAAATAAPTAPPPPTAAPPPTAVPQPTDEIEVPTMVAELSTDTPVQDVSAPSSSADIDPCALLDPDAVKVLYGKLGTAPVAKPTDKHNGRACTFDAQKVTLTVEVYDSNDAPVSVLLPELAQRGITMTPEAGTGDESYSGSTTDRAILLEVKNNTVVLLDLVNKSDTIKRAAVLMKGLSAAALMHLPEPALTIAETSEPLADTSRDATSESTAPSNASDDTRNACALLSEDEVEQLLGKLDSPPDGSVQDDSGAPSCAYSAKDALIFISSSSGGDTAIQRQIQQAKQHGASLEPVAGLGDAAYIAAAKMDGAPNKDAVQGIIIVRSGDTVLRLGSLSNMDPDKTKSVLQQLAQMALGRVS